MEPNSTWRPNRLNAASFITQLDTQKPRVRQILDELQKLDYRLKRIQHVAQIFKCVTGLTVIVGTVSAALIAAALSMVEAPFAFVADVLLKAFLVAFTVCGLAFAPVVLLCEVQRKIEEQSLAMFDELRTTVASLDSEMEDVKSSCAELRRGTCGAEALKFIRLEINILEQFAISADLRTSVTARCMTEALSQYNKVFDGFENVKKRLQSPNNAGFREVNDTEVTLFNIVKLFMSNL